MQHWRHVLQQLQLSPQQQQQVAMAHQRMVQHLLPLLQERQLLAAQLAAAAAMPSDITYVKLSAAGVQVRHLCTAGPRR